MAREYTTVIGSGQVPHISTAPPYSLPDGSYPIPAKSTSPVRTRTGDGAVVLNPEDFSVSIGISTTSITVGTSPTPLPDSPLEFRRALVVHNASAGTIYLGNSSVTTSNGLPLAAGEKIAFDIQGNPNVEIYGIAGSNLAVRIMELA